MPESRRHIAVMFTDIVGYTALMGSDEDKAFDMLKRNHTIHATLIRKHNGKLIKEIGDGTLASFPLASDAVRCAMDIQIEAKSQNIPLKIGIHQGEMVMAGGDVLGDGVNVASRLQESAAEGCISISGAVYHDVKNKAGIRAEYLEDKTFKNVEEPLKVYKVIYEVEQEESLLKNKTINKSTRFYYYIIGSLVLLVSIMVLIWFLYHKQEENIIDIEIKKSIAVLPFRNDSPDQANEYFCNGMMEAILNHLVKIGDLHVLSRTDVEPYRKTTKSREEIAKELGVANILEGSVQKQGNKFRISVQLINAESGFHLWSETYENDYTQEIFSIQSHIAQQIAAELKVVITPDEEKQIKESPTSNVEAYDLVIQGWQYLLNFQTTSDKEDFEITIDLFSKALKIDPDYARAYVGLASIYLEAGYYDSIFHYVDKAIALDPSESGSYHMRGYYYYLIGEADKAISDQLKAMELPKPDSGYPELWLGITYCDLKKDYLKGVPHLINALTNCKEGAIPLAYVLISRVFINVGDFKLANLYLNKALELHVGCYGLLHKYLVYIIQGEFNEAYNYINSNCNESTCENYCNWCFLEHFKNQKKFLKCEPYYAKLKEENFPFQMLAGWADVNWAYANWQLGKKEEAQQIFNKIISESKNQFFKGYYWASLDISRINAFLNNKEESIRYLKECEKYGFQFGFHNYIMFDPLFENLRNDTDFLEIVNRIQEEKAQSRKQIRQLEEEGVL